MVDTYFRKGLYKAPLPAIIGSDGAGIIAKIGGEVSNELGFKVGDKVGFFQNGATAQFCCVPAIKCYPIPEFGTYEDAVCLSVNGLTAHYLSRSCFKVSKNDIVLIHAVSGATGSLIAQICKRFECIVIGTCSTSKIEIAKQNGCDYVIDYKKQNFVEEVKKICEKINRKGVDVVYDGVGKATYEGSMDVLRPRGYCILFGNASGAVPPINPLTLVQKGSIFLTRPSLKHYVGTYPKETIDRAKDLFDWIKDKTLKPRIHQTLPMKDVKKGHQIIESGKTTGKIVINIDP